MQANMNMQKYAKNSKGQKKFVFFLAIKKLFPRPALPSEEKRSVGEYAVFLGFLSVTRG